MCILFIYTNPDPKQGKYQIIIATNRDEYYNRPASPAHRWIEDDFIIGGKDLEAGREGGTWFGISLKQSGTFRFRAAALLNVTGEPRKSGAAGRGSIVTDYLKDILSAEEYVERRIKPNATTYNAFSFVAVELSDSTSRTTIYTNVTNTLTVSSHPSPYYSGLGNSLLHEPFSKVLAGKNRFETAISKNDIVSDPSLLKNELLELLKWEEKHLPDPVLERRAPDIQEQLSQVFVNFQQAGYGTRTHTLVLVDNEGAVDFLEDTLLSDKWIRSEFKARL